MDERGAVVAPLQIIALFIFVETLAELVDYP
ncbi:hypothetical protein X953_04215 [Virgibacillus sp. SK37]|nr:hypothetical protein X953_04215 [Virgibacillus sp. SK37]